MVTPEGHAPALLRGEWGADDLTTLFDRCSAGDGRARETIILRFLPLARAVARRYEGRGEPLDDLLQVGRALGRGRGSRRSRAPLISTRARSPRHSGPGPPTGRTRWTRHTTAGRAAGSPLTRSSPPTGPPTSRPRYPSASPRHSVGWAGASTTSCCFGCAAISPSARSPPVSACPRCTSRGSFAAPARLWPPPAGSS
jgi:hypothetical protein